MKFSIQILLINLFILQGLFAQKVTKKDFDILMTITMHSVDKTTNAIFFTNSSYSVQEFQNGQNNGSTSSTLSPTDFRSLEKLIKASRPIILRDKYSCNGKTIDKQNAIIYQFAKSKKTVMADNACKTTKKLGELTIFVKNVLERD
ncbi:hypothetical protein [uncultured Croceitalea sp.]|uniref:hypothetical protein n=1 Tax=uncultured Croceitalea sp. TaxID=1798908 RepID=UPI003305FF1D